VSPCPPHAPCTTGDLTCLADAPRCAPSASATAARRVLACTSTARSQSGRVVLLGAATDKLYVLKREEAASSLYHIVPSMHGFFYLICNLNGPGAQTKQQRDKLRQLVEGPLRLAECMEVAKSLASLSAAETAVFLSQPLPTSPCLRHFPLGVKAQISLKSSRSHITKTQSCIAQLQIKFELS
jgi:hypothetical protein